MNSTKKIKAGIIGGAGYTGGELLRILLNHPQVNIGFVHSKSKSGKLICDVHTDLIGDCELRFSSELDETVDVLFLCVGHGEASVFLKENKINKTIKIIDLSQDHRLNNNEFVYGLPELNREKITKANYIANPGCFATCIQLALLPLAAHKLLHEDIHVSATTGSTGAGQSLSPTSHFSWRQNNLSIYKAFEHQHLHEIGQSLIQLQNEFKKELNFVPYRGSFTRGIIASVYTNCNLSIDKVRELYQSYYAPHPFVHISESAIDLKQIVNTNKGLLQFQQHGNKLLITSCIDNLLKGASGQAVQNMNLLFGLNEKTGLNLKASYF
ncbi:MAG TPA: N-acetyl-gamma-glutamyl-phosphate reductase [Bacteroidia bacterium]|nr:N-acetyl-gamma-glutamyl-phosphate reductase [Bacteroidia bacterium]